MNRLNEQVKELRRKRRRRILIMCAIFYVLGLLVGHFVFSKEDHAQAPVQVQRSSAVAPLRLSPDRHEAAVARADRTRLPTPRHRVVRTNPQPRRVAVPSDSPFERWRTSSAARAVVQCESGNDGSWAWHHGKYRGRWQMDADFWRTYGGRAYASSPELADVRDQDWVAYRGFLDRGWQPWTCARIVGLI